MSDKIKKVQKGIEKLNDVFDKNTARDLLANAQELQAMADPCLRARKCILNSKSNADRDKNNKDPKTACCGSQTGHHLLHEAMFRAKNGNNCTGYKGEDAPTVCAEGTSHSKGGSHQSLHTIYKKDYNENKDSTYTKEKMIDKMVEHHAKAFPMSHCNKKCIRNQLREGHKDVKCKDDMKMPNVPASKKGI